jgi:hypothetical protein
MSTTETPTEAPKPAKKKRIRGDAITRLAKESASQVRDKSEKIIDALVGRVLEGDVNCTKLLVMLIERLPPPKRKHHSMALQWVKSGPWRGPEGTRSIPMNEEEEDEETNHVLGKEFVTALENYRRAEREMAARDAASPTKTQA